jgi:hypothetical protein
VISGSNLKHFFFGGTRGNEMRETERAWEETQGLWRASPFGTTAISEFAIALVRKAAAGAPRAPAVPILAAIAEAVVGLYWAEDVSDLEARWDVLYESTEAAVELRAMLPRRRRWAVDFARMQEAFSRIVSERLHRLFERLPESCFQEWDEEVRDTFETPLIDLLDNPADVVDELFMLPYEDDAFRLDLFHSLRELSATNLLIASGFLPTDDLRAKQSKLVRAPQQKDKTGAELADLYLRGSPLKELLDIRVPFRIPEELRFEHCHIVGGTGHGKTQLMQKLIHADLLANAEDGRSVIVIDSQGDLINKIMRLELFSPYKAGSLADQLVIIDPADVDFPAALNLFDAHIERAKAYSGADRERVLNGVIELYEMFFGAFLGAELTQKQGVIFKYLARLMLAIPDATIYTLMKIMEDGKPFKPYMDELDGSARYFFETEFFHPSFAATKKQVLRRLWGVLSTPAFERMFTQPKNKLDLFEAMNEGKIVLVNTAKDLLKREGSQLLGRFFIAMITQAALERSTIPEHRRRSVFVYVDEAQEYFDDSIETILNQARKYRVGLTLAHQTLDQLSPKLRSAMLTNTSVKCVGGVSAKDARVLAEELRTTPEFIEGMKRRGPRSEFALWVKHLTGTAIRLSVPLGFLESQPTIDVDELETLWAFNRIAYCGTLAEIPKLTPTFDAPSSREPQSARPPPPSPKADPPPAEPIQREAAASEPEAEREEPTPPQQCAQSPKMARERPQPLQRDLGKGGKQHRYLQALIKELAEQQGLKATIEASLPGAPGQIDVLIERDGPLAAFEISVSTPVEHEKENLRKCLASDCPRVAVVLAKAKSVQKSYRAALEEAVPEGKRHRVSYLTPEELPAFIVDLAPPPESSERVVKGYRVKGSFKKTTHEDGRAREEAVTQIIVKSLGNRKRD